MNKLFLIAFTLICAIALNPTFAASPSAICQQDAGMAQKYDGMWQGALMVGAVKLRLLLKMEKNADSTLKGSLDSIDQGAKNLTIDVITFQGTEFKFEMKGLNATFTGRLSNDGNEIIGEWKQGPGALPLTFKKTDKPVTFNRPQEPKRPYPYEEVEVTYDNKKEGNKIAGTLTLPRSKGPHPVVLLITGSGPQDRDESLLTHKPFLVISDYLTRQGIAVLRVDDRGVGGSSKGTPNDTSESYAGDVVAGVEFLKGRPEINPKQIGLIGHSEGGLIAPIAAVNLSDVAFIVMLAGPGQRGDDLLLDQSMLVAKALGVSDQLLAKSRVSSAQTFEILRQEKDNAVAEKRLREINEKSLAEMSEADKKALGATPERINAQIALILTPWFRYFLSYDPRPTLMKVKCPVLAINGELDLQVPANNIKLIEDALKEGGNKDVTVAVLPKLNHLFQTSKTGSPTEYGEIEETFSPIALEMMAKWITQRTGNR
jgi:uncharacterized protein